MNIEIEHSREGTWDGRGRKIKWIKMLIHFLAFGWAKLMKEND